MYSKKAITNAAEGELPCSMGGAVITPRLMAHMWVVTPHSPARRLKTISGDLLNLIETHQKQ